MKTNTSHVMRALIEQVSKAAGGHPETEVITFITKPMWKAFMKECGCPANSKPTDWTTIKDTRRVYGSKTIVVDGNRKMESFSVLIARYPDIKPTSLRKA